MKRSYMRRFFAAFIPLFLLFSGSLKACSCSGSPVDLPIREIGLGMAEAAYRSVDAEIIFEGILLERTHDSTRHVRDYRMLFEVTDVYKGNCVDTIAVYTSNTGGACGFWAKEGTYSIVFAAKDTDGTLFSHRADCWQGANEGYHPDRFQWFRSFLISLTYRIDGDYKFHQKISHWGYKNDPRDNVPAVEYSIQNGNLNGPWLLYNRRGEIVESGRYKNGKRTGTWLYRMEKDNETGYGKISSLVHINF